MRVHTGMARCMTYAYEITRLTFAYRDCAILIMSELGVDIIMVIGSIAVGGLA